MPDIKAERPVIAGPLIRLSAVVYDGLLVLALIALVGTALIIIGTSSQVVQTGQAGKLSDAYRHFVLFPSFVAVTWWFYGMFWRRTGQTLGMQTWRLKTIRVDGYLLDWRLSIIRCACACILPTICALIGYLVHRTPIALTMSFMVGFVFNYVFALINDKHLALHDILSRTVTVRLPAGPPSQLLQRLFKKKSQ